MAVFAVISEKAENSALDAKVMSLYDVADRYRVASHTWLVSDDKLVQTIAENLGINNGGAGRAVVLRVGPYFGWHDKALWEWLSLKGVQ